MSKSEKPWHVCNLVVNYTKRLPKSQHFRVKTKNKKHAVVCQNKSKLVKPWWH